MDKDRALDKIRKCLRLAKSANAGEAANALRQAQTLMRLHGVDEADVQLADVGERSTHARMQTVTVWETKLARLIAEAFGCELFSSQVQQLKRGSLTFAWQRTWCFVGLHAAPEVATYAMDVLSRQCAKVRTQHIAAQPKACKPSTKTARGDEFARAWVIGVAGLVHAQSGGDRHTELLLQYMQRKHPSMGTVKPTNRAIGRNVNERSAEAGYFAGKCARLDQALGAAEAPMALR